MTSQAYGYESKWTQDINQMQFQQQWDSQLQASARQTTRDLMAAVEKDMSGSKYDDALFYGSILATPLLFGAIAGAGGGAAPVAGETAADTIINIFINTP